MDFTQGRYIKVYFPGSQSTLFNQATFNLVVLREFLCRVWAKAASSRNSMKTFTLCVIMVTLLGFFLNTLETEGQLSFNPRRPPGTKPGRSLDQVSTKLFQSARVKFRNDIFVGFLLRRGGREGGGGGGREIRTSRFPYPALPPPVLLSPLMSALVCSAPVPCKYVDSRHTLDVSFPVFLCFQHYTSTVKGFLIIPDVSLSFF